MYRVLLRQRISRRYISRKPKAKVKWFYSTDAPITKPDWYDYQQDSKPEKFVPFSDYDTHRLEAAHGRKANSVDVREDRLFEVNLGNMELSPVYWKGPAYEVRRGTWFTSDGLPLSASLAQKIEEGYDKYKPYATKPPSPDFALEFAKSPKDAIARFNDLIKNNIENDTIDFSKEADAIDLGDQAVIYFDAVNGALFPNNFNLFQLNVIRNFGSNSGALLSVTMIQRGFTEGLGNTVLDSVKSAPVPSLTELFLTEVTSLFLGKEDSKILKGVQQKEKEDALQQVMENDYKNVESSSDAVRDIDHLVLCVHGIGQILGFKYESVNFTHSINVLRNTMRDVFSNEEKYQKLAYGDEHDEKNKKHTSNNKIQVLPVSWRHEITFQPKKGFEIFDDAGAPRLPTLGQINVDGILPLRNIVGDVVLDVLLYYEPRYIKEIFKVVVTELNKVHQLYLEKNPQFKGKVHILGHSLGSAIAFDLMCKQSHKGPEDKNYGLDFDVENLFCVGSPVGMFKLLQQKNIRPRSEVPDDFDPLADEHIVSPKCANLYNIFHPCDPVSYRMEPLVNPKFGLFKAEEVPFALKGFNTQVRSLTTFGDEVLEKVFLASNWFRNEKKPTSQTSEQQAAKENALGDIISTLTSAGNKDSRRKTKEVQMTEEDIAQLTGLNRTGRIDYSLPMGVFSIALISAISAHVSYFEDQETAGFVMREILSTDVEPVKSKKVVVYS